MPLIQISISVPEKGACVAAQSDKKVIVNIRTGGYVSPAVPLPLVNPVVNCLVIIASYSRMSSLNNNNNNNRYIIMDLLLCKYFT